MATDLEKRTESFAEIKKLLGPAPLLTSESQEVYDGMLWQFIEVVKPRDFLGYMFAKDLADQTLEMIRSNRHKTWSVERKDRLWREADAKKLAGNKDRSELREKLINAATPQERVEALELFMSQNQSEVMKLLENDSHTGESRAMEAAMDMYERHDGIYGVSFERRKQTIELFTIYNELLNQQMRQTIQQPLEAEASEASTVPALPAG